jgi:hypothetical protein
MSTLGARSFTTFDKPDGLGIRAQVVVSTGALPVKRVTPGDRGIAKIEFDHTAADLKFGVHGNVPENAPFYQALLDAVGTGQPVNFRLETQRKKDTDRTLPFPPHSDKDRKDGQNYLTTTGGEDVVKKVVMINGVASDEMRTEPAEDEKWANTPKANLPTHLSVDPNAAPAAPAQSGHSVTGEGAYKALAAMAEQGGYSVGIAENLASTAIAAGADPAKVAPLAEKASAVTPPKRGVVSNGIREAAPMYANNWDRGRNLGSYEIGAVLATMNWAESHVRACYAAYNERVTGSATVPSVVDAEAMLRGSAGALTAILLDIADRIQVDLYATENQAGRPNRMASSHGKIRGTLFHVLEMLLADGDSFIDRQDPASAKQRLAEACEGLTGDDLQAKQAEVNEAEGQARSARWADWQKQVYTLARARHADALMLMDDPARWFGFSRVSPLMEQGSEGGNAVDQDKAEVKAEDKAEDKAEVKAEAEVVSEAPAADARPETSDERAPEPQTAEEKPEPQSAAPANSGAQPLPFTAPDLGPFDKDEMGGAAPDPSDVDAFKRLCELAGLMEQPRSIVAYLDQTFHVRTVASVHQPRLAALLAHYRSFGADGPARFRDDVTAVSGAVAA